MATLIFRTLRSIGLALVVIGAAASAANAVTLDEARTQGLVGERPDGLVGAVAPSPAPDVKALVDSVNAARLASYKDVAQKNGTPIDAVQMVAGEKQVQKAKENKWYYLGAGGAWSR